MIYKVVNSIVVIAIIVAMIFVMFALRMSFSTVNKNINSNRENIETIHGNQEDIVNNLLEFTRVAEAMSNQIYINKVELEKLKNELGQPNNLDEKAEELFNILAEE
jgi:peptidoglycan hydrolase CwlO-like protein